MVGLLAALALPVSARADVELDPATDTVRVAGRVDGGTLTRPASGAAATIGLRYVHEHRASLGLTAADLDTLADPTVKSSGGIRQVRWRQEVDGIPVADAELRVNVTDDGRVINVLGSPSSSLPQDTSPLLAKPQPDAELTIYTDRLAYRYVDEAAPDEIYDTIADADTGKVLKRTNLVKEATGRVWENHPGAGAALGGNAVDTVFPAIWLTSTTKLESTFVHVYSDTNADNVAQASEEVVPGTYDFNAFTAPSGCSTLPCGWDGNNSTKATNRNQNGVQAFYFANRFREHLAAAPINFAGFGDQLLLETNDGGGTNNANMYTPPVGKSPRMQMYFWGLPGNYRYINSGDDASILYHEYVHGLTGRLVIDADGVSALGSWQAGAMGEGWSDWYAKDFLVGQFPALDQAGTNGDVHMGVYADIGFNKIRSQGIDCPVDVVQAPYCPLGGYTYGDFGSHGGPEFHYDGEIWAQTLWDLRTAIGSTASRRLITAALRISPAEPSFLDMRNAILQADAASASQFHDQIWEVFRARGMGFYASTTGGADYAPVEDFSPPPAAGDPRGAITGKVLDGTAPVVGVTVSVGGMADGPDALKATTDANGDYTISGVPVGPRAKTVVLRAAGYDEVVVKNVAVPGTANAQVRRNWASARGSAPATITSTAGNENGDSGCGLKHAVDGVTGSTWSTAARTSLVVRLPRAITVNAIGIDPTEGCADGQTSATRTFRVEVSTNGTTWDVIKTGTAAETQRLTMNRFSVAERSGVQYVRLTPLTNGGDTYMDVTEFAVYGVPSFEAAITSGPTGPVAAAAFTFTGSGTTGFECRIDAGTFTACVSGITYSALADGPHRFEVRGVNGADRTAVAAFDFTINTVLPSASIDSAPPALTRNATAMFAFSGVGARFECSWDGAVYATCTSGASRTLGDGGHTFAVRAVNNMGTSAPATHSFTVDTTPPNTTFSVSPPPILTFDHFNVVFGANEPATFTCSIDGRASTACTSPLALTGLSDGPHSVVVTATDMAGNTALTPARSEFTVDTTLPTTFLDSTPPVLTRSSTVTFTFSGTGSGFQCSWDGQAYAACTSGASRALTDGMHTFVVRAVNDVGVDPEPRRFTFTVDTTPPETTFTWGAPAIVTTRDFTFSFVSSEDGTFMCSIDGGQPAPCSSPFAVIGMSEGPHSVAVTAVDLAGNVDPTPATSNFIVVIPQLPPTPTPTPTPAASSTPTPTPTVIARPKVNALTSASVPKFVTRTTAKVKVTVRGVKGAKIMLQAKLGSRVVGKATKTLGGSSGSFQLTLDKRRLKPGATVTVRVQATGSGMTPVTRSLRFRLKG